MRHADVVETARGGGFDGGHQRRFVGARGADADWTGSSG
ncbi:hypothetical protein BURPS406E_G0358 [Burkholderia pseudomallei 406e]|nr:hypothetical protein BURPS406E_G0358 [Burkholderia pseudomallei 406e]EEH26400.1 hypothetical protein BUH_5523 [Burkholderia pseudomallei Pakistan 9]